MASSLLTRSLLFLFLVLSRPAGAAPGIKVSHSPKQPKSGETVSVTIDMPAFIGEPLLQFQVVEPGAYIALDDPAYSNWSQITLKTVPGAPNRSAFEAELPAELQKNRRLIRYRLLSGKTVIAPDEDDSAHNFAYFVYDGIPEWRAAINPKGTGKEREAITFSPAVMSSVQAYHLISKQASVEKVTWRERVNYMQPGASQYKYTGTLVADGIVYDHIHFRARGGAWRYAMGKNMWKIDFNKGHHLEARDNRGEKYRSKWGKLNLGACIQQGDYGMRGEHGMLEAATFQLFNLAGVDAPHTHWIQLRIVDEAEENPASQYRGDFWGLYLAVENLDDDFLKEHRLPDGNLYKMDVTGPEPENIGRSGPKDRSDVLEFMRELQKRRDEKWWRSNVSLPRYYSYRAIVECVHHYDIGSGKNYFYFNNPDTKQWQVIPWDVDLTWADRMYGDGDEPFFSTGLLQREPFRSEYMTRLAELRDLLFNPEQAGALIDELAGSIWDPKGTPSMADADRAKWDYHPVMSSNLTQRGKSDPGLFYKSTPTRDFRGMLRIMKNYVEERGRWIDRTLLADPGLPATPTLASPEISPQRISVRLKTPASAPRLRWRLAEISDPKKPRASEPRKYEIDALWEKEGAAIMEFPMQDLKSGHLYRIRSRAQGTGGEWSHWSAPVQFTVP